VQKTKREEENTVLTIPNTIHTYSTTRFQIVLHATELKLIYTAEVKDSPSDT